MVRSVAPPSTPPTSGWRLTSLEELRGGDAETNAEVVRRVLAGKQGPHRDIAVLNAAAGLVVAGLSADLAEGVERAGAVIDDGAARHALDRLVQTSQDAAATSA